MPVYTDPAAAEASVLTLQAFLIMLAIPLLCLAALIEERYRARIDLGARLAFEAVLARVSASFVHVPAPDIPGAFETSLERLGRFIGLDGLALLEFPAAGGSAQTIATWTAVERTRPLMTSLGESCPWTMGQLLGKRDVAVARWTNCRPTRRRTVERWKPQRCARRWRCRWSSAAGSSAGWSVSRWPMSGSATRRSSTACGRLPTSSAAPWRDSKPTARCATARR